MALPNVRGNRTGNRPSGRSPTSRAPAAPRPRRSRAGPGRARLACGSPVRPAHRTRWIGPSAGGPHRAGDVGPKSTTDGVPSAVARCATPVSPHTTRPAAAIGRRQLAHGRAARQDVGVVRARPWRATAARETPLVRAAGDHDPSPGGALGGDRRAPSARPASGARATRRARDGRSWRRGCRRGRRRRAASMRRSAGSACDTGWRQQPAPARDLVLVLPQAGPVGCAVAGERDQPPRLPVGAAAAVRLSGPRPCRLTAHVGAARAAAGSGARPSVRARPGRPLAGQARPAAPARPAPPARARRPGEGRARAPRSAGTAVSRSPTPSARRTRRPHGPRRLRRGGDRPARGPRTPGGRVEREQRPPRPRSAGSLSTRVRAGLVPLVAVVEEPRPHPARDAAASRRPRPPSSAASARVKPTTPNLLAQYAVASPTAPAGRASRRRSRRGPAVRSRCGQRGADDGRGAEQVDRRRRGPRPRRAMSASAPQHVHAGRGHHAARGRRPLDHRARPPPRRRAVSARSTTSCGDAVGGRRAGRARPACRRRRRRRRRPRRRGRTARR